MLTLGFWSCGGVNSPTSSTAEDTVTRRYVGTIPAADGPGLTMDLTLLNIADSTGGKYELSMTYREAENGKDRTFRSLGTWETESGIPSDAGAVYYRLVESSPWADTLNLLYLGDSVMLLGTDLTKPALGQHYTLVKVLE